MNKKNLAIALLAGMLAVGGLTACNNSGGSTPSPTPTPTVTHDIKVSAATGVKYSVSKTSASAGETITVTVSEVPSGYVLSGVTYNDNDATKKDNNTYTFIMPDDEVTVKISVKADTTQTEYAIKVTAPDAVSYTISKAKAKQGETVTLVINSVAASYSIKSVVLNVATTLTPGEDGKTYTFTMPNTSASIVITCNVEGEVVVTGDISVALTKNEETGIYEAKNVLVTNGSEEFAKINFKVGDSVLSALDFDEARSFGSIELCTSRDYALEIATNTYYDFYYDPSLNGTTSQPCSIQRVGLSVLPNDVDSLSNVMITGNCVRSEEAQYTGDLLSVNYRVINTDGSDVSDYVNQEYSWNRYLNNVSYAHVVEKDQMGDETESMDVYKSYDVNAGALEVIDTYAKYNGNLLANDDHFRENYNNNTEYSARYDVTTDASVETGRFTVDDKNANRMVNTSSHMPNGYYGLEREIMYSYRVGFEEVDETSASNVSISSTRHDNDNGFTTTINSFVEYNSEEGTYTSEMHEAHVFTVTLDFDERGATTGVNFVKVLYGESSWDFTNHTPLLGAKGSTVKKIVASYTYGEPTEAFDKAATNYDPENYFINKINSIVFNNEKTGQTSTDKASYVELGDELALTEIGTNTISCEKFDFSPATALDAWQYAATASSDESVVVKEATDLYNVMTTVGIGESDVTFTNHCSQAASASYQTKVAVSCSTKIRDIYLLKGPNYVSWDSVTNATPETVKAGSIKSYQVVTTPSGKAPTIYHPVAWMYNADKTEKVDASSYVSITSADNSKYLVLNFDPAAATGVTSNVTIYVTLYSAAFDQTWGDAYNKGITFTWYVTPADVSPVGNWKAVDVDAYPDTTINFTTEEYDGKVESGFGTAYKGVIVDNYYDPSTKQFQGTDTYYFYYKFDNSTLSAVVYGYDLQSYNPEDYEDETETFEGMYIDFYYDGSTNHYGVFLAMSFYSTYYEDYYYYEILGELDTSGEPYSYVAFEKVD